MVECAVDNGSTVTWRPAQLLATGLVFLMALSVTRPAMAANADDVIGEWRTPASINVQMFACDKSVCARIVRMPDTSVADMHNPDPRLRTRPVLGIQVMTEMRRSGPHGWKGRMYYYENGYSYPARLLNLDRNRLQIEVCGPMGFFCTREVWTRTR